MDAGTLQLKLMADISDLVSKMATAKENVSSSMNAMTGAIDFAKGALIGLIGVGSVGAFATMIKGSIDATGALKDFATQTGASEAALGEFRKMGSYTDTSIDSITGSMGKLSKNMVAGTEDSKGAGIAIKALGLDFNTIRAMKPEDQMLAIAGSMNTFADGADKSAVAQALFGKEGAKLLPFLKDLGEDAAAITTKLTDQEIALKKTQAAMADAFGDNLNTIRKNSESWKKDLAMGMTPALYEASQAFLDVSKTTSGLKGEISTLSKDGSITDWTRSSITVLTYLMDGFSGVGTVVKSVGLTIGAWAAGVGSAVSTAMTVVKQAADGDFSGAMATMKGGIEQQKTIANELTTSLDATWGEQTLGSKLRARIEDLKTTGLTAEHTKKQMDAKAVLEANEAAHKASAEAQKEAEKQARALAAEIKKQDEEYAKLNGSITSKISNMQAELDAGTPLMAWQKELNTVLAGLSAGTLKLTQDQAAATVQHILEMGAIEKLVAQQKEEEKQLKANQAENANFSTKLMKSTDDTNAAAEKIREHTETLGLNKDELELLIIQKGYDQAATYDEKAAWAEQNLLGADLVQQYKDQAAALRNLADAKQQGIHVKAAVDAQIAWQKTTDSIANGLGSALATAIGQGKDLWLTFRDYMVRVILDGAIKNALTSVFSEGINWLTSVITGIKIGSTGSTLSTGSSIASTASSIASTASTVGSVLTGATSVANGVGTIFANATGGGIDALLATNGAYGTAAATTATGAAATGAVATGAEVGAGAVATGAEVGGATVAGAGTSAIPIIGLFYLGMKALGQGQTDGLPSELELYRATHNGENPPDWIDGQGGGGGGGGGSMSSIGLNGGSATNADTMTSIPLSTIPNRASLQGANSDLVRVDGAMGTNLYWTRDLAVTLNDYAAVNGRAAATQRAYDLGATETILDQIRRASVGVPQFLGGGDHFGGARIVGENGPELEVTGPSRIFNAEQTASMLRSGGATDSEVGEELRMMREALNRMEIHIRRTADATNGNPESPMIVEIDA